MSCKRCRGANSGRARSICPWAQSYQKGYGMCVYHTHHIHMLLVQCLHACMHPHVVHVCVTALVCMCMPMYLFLVWQKSWLHESTCLRIWEHDSRSSKSPYVQPTRGAFA